MAFQYCCPESVADHFHQGQHRCPWAFHNPHCPLSCLRNFYFRRPIYQQDVRCPGCSSSIRLQLTVHPSFPRPIRLQPFLPRRSRPVLLPTCSLSFQCVHSFWTPCRLTSMRNLCQTRHLWAQGPASPEGQSSQGGKARPWAMDSSFLSMKLTYRPIYLSLRLEAAEDSILLDPASLMNQEQIAHSCPLLLRLEMFRLLSP